MRANDLLGLIEDLRFWLRKWWRRFVRWTVADPLAAFLLGVAVTALVWLVVA